MLVLKESKREQQEKSECQPLVWNFETLFAYLQDEDIVDLVIENADSSLMVGVRSEFNAQPRLYNKNNWENKVYYIDEDEFANFEEFKARLLYSMSNAENILILSAKMDDMVLDLSKWKMKN